MNSSPRGACESCVNFTKLGDPHRRWFLCEVWDWRSKSSYTYTSCPYFARKKYSRKTKHKEDYLSSF